MRKIILSEQVSVDGIAESPERWRFNYNDQALMRYSVEELNAFDAFLMGRKTYQGFAAYWPTQTHNEFGMADKLNNTRKYVVSTTLEKADWNNSMIVRGNLTSEIQKLKNEHGGDIGLSGSIGLVQSLMQENLIDEYRFLTFPVAIGSGRRLFKEGVSLSLDLVELKAFDSGVVLSRYVPKATTTI